MGGELGVNLGNYLQGMHLRNINTVGMDYALKINPLLGLNVEFQVISSYLNGKVLIGPQSQALTGTITGTALVLDAAPATPLTVGTSLVFSNAGTLSNTTITAITDPTHFTVGGGAVDDRRRGVDGLHRQRVLCIDGGYLLRLA